MKPDVVIGYDQTRTGENALDEAAAEAVRRGAGLTIVHAFHHRPVVWPSHGEPVAERELDGAARAVAQEGADRVGIRHPGLPVQPRAEAGPVASILADLSSDADLLVVGHNGHGGFSGLHPGSVALRTVAHATCPTVVVRGAGHGTRGAVLAAVDLGAAAEETLEFAFTEAAQRAARLKAVSALDVLWPWAPADDRGHLARASNQVRERAETALEHLLEPWQAKYPEVPVDHEVVEGSPSVMLTAATTYADLVVVGAHRRGHGHRGVHVGPVVHALLLHADCPVAVVPHG